MITTQRKHAGKYPERNTNSRKNHRNINLQTKKSKTITNQITPKKITQTTPPKRKLKNRLTTKTIKNT
jgi:hypothetical protein